MDEQLIALPSFGDLLHYRWQPFIHGVPHLYDLALEVLLARARARARARAPHGSRVRHRAVRRGGRRPSPRPLPRRSRGDGGRGGAGAHASVARRVGAELAAARVGFGRIIIIIIAVVVLATYAQVTVPAEPGLEGFEVLLVDDLWRVVMVPVLGRFRLTRILKTDADLLVLDVVHYAFLPLAVSRPDHHPVLLLVSFLRSLARQPMKLRKTGLVGFRNPLVPFRVPLDVVDQHFRPLRVHDVRFEPHPPPVAAIDETAHRQVDLRGLRGEHGRWLKLPRPLPRRPAARAAPAPVGLRWRAGGYSYGPVQVEVRGLESFPGDVLSEAHVHHRLDHLASLVHGVLGS
mmetsp:Transcript_19183/g.38794  ORF Transcript_19183/g.38794 Transcript_19183/m.38794 type:complete len:346 (-) Transcript_19183:121-1158(-)